MRVRSLLQEASHPCSAGPTRHRNHSRHPKALFATVQDSADYSSTAYHGVVHPRGSKLHDE